MEKAAFVYRFDSMIESGIRKTTTNLSPICIVCWMLMVHKPQAHRRSYLDGVLEGTCWKNPVVIAT